MKNLFTRTTQHSQLIQDGTIHISSNKRSLPPMHVCLWSTCVSYPCFYLTWTSYSSFFLVQIIHTWEILLNIYVLQKQTDARKSLIQILIKRLKFLMFSIITPLMKSYYEDVLDFQCKFSLFQDVWSYTWSSNVENSFSRTI